MPYIWIFMALPMKRTPSDLAKWSLDNYVELRKGPHDFENFCSGFRALRSGVYNEVEVVSLSDLHRGALLQPGLQDVHVVNMPLQVAKAQNWMATNGADFLRRKDQRGKTSAVRVVGRLGMEPP